MFERVANAVRAIVARKNHQRVFGNAEFVQHLQQRADVAVHARDHRGLRFLIFRPGPVFVNVERGNFKPRVRNGVRQVQEKRIGLLVAHKLQCLAREQVVGIRVAVEHDFLIVSPQVLRVIRVGFALAVVPKKVIEALIVGIALRTGIPQSPFANASGGIPGASEQLGSRLRVAWDGDIALNRQSAVVAHIRMPRVQPGHEHAPRRRANRRPGVVIRKANALGGNAVDMRGINQLLTKTPQIPIPEIVRQDVNDIRQGFFSHEF